MLLVTGASVFLVSVLVLAYGYYLRRGWTDDAVRETFRQRLTRGEHGLGLTLDVLKDEKAAKAKSKVLMVAGCIGLFTGAILIVVSVL